MCAGFLTRSFFAFYIYLPHVVIPRLHVDMDYLGMGSVEWDSDTEDEIPDEQVQEGPPKKRAKVDTADKKPEAEAAMYGPMPKPQ